MRKKEYEKDGAMVGGPVSGSLTGEVGDGARICGDGQVANVVAMIVGSLKSILQK